MIDIWDPVLSCLEEGVRISSVGVVAGFAELHSGPYGHSLAIILVHFSSGDTAVRARRTPCGSNPLSVSSLLPIGAWVALAFHIL